MFEPQNAPRDVFAAGLCPRISEAGDLFGRVRREGTKREERRDGRERKRRGMRRDRRKTEGRDEGGIGGEKKTGRRWKDRTKGGNSGPLD